MVERTTDRDRPPPRRRLGRPRGRAVRARRRAGPRGAHGTRTPLPTARDSGHRHLLGYEPVTFRGMARMAGTAALAETLLDVAVVSTTSVAGGDICTTTRLRLTDGRSAVIKTRPQAPAGFFTTEAEGLRRLRAAGGAGRARGPRGRRRVHHPGRGSSPRKPSADLAESLRPRPRGHARRRCRRRSAPSATATSGWPRCPTARCPRGRSSTPAAASCRTCEAAVDRGSLSLEQAASSRRS